MDVLVTGGAGTIGTALAEHLADEHSLTSFDVEEHPHPDVDSIVGDAREYDELRAAAEGADALVHLARVTMDRGSASDRSIVWTDDHVANLRGHANAVGAAVDAGVDSLVYASSNHAVGMYEVENAPDIYYPGFDLTVDHTAPPRPDSMYGAAKVYGEGLARLAAEAHGLRSYALRICSVHDSEWDHPYGTAERGVDRGEFERGGDEYRERVARQKCMWQSRRDVAHLVDRCLRDETVEFDIFYGVSDNDRRWFDIDHARETIGYEPRDDADEWDAPPE